METPARGKLKRRDVTLNPLSEEWFRRKATPFGVRLLGGGTRPRPDYTRRVLNKGLEVSIHPFALITRPIPIRKLIELGKTINPAALPFAKTRSGREIMSAQANSARKKEEALARGRSKV